MLVATQAALCLCCMQISTNLPTLQCPRCGSQELHWHRGFTRTQIAVWWNTDAPAIEYWYLKGFPVVAVPRGRANIEATAVGG